MCKHLEKHIYIYQKTFVTNLRRRDQFLTYMYLTKAIAIPKL